MRRAVHRPARRARATTSCTCSSRAWRACSTARSRPPRVVDLIDALSLNMERRARRDHGPARWLAALEAKRLARYERGSAAPGTARSSSPRSTGARSATSRTCSSTRTASTSPASRRTPGRDARARSCSPATSATSRTSTAWSGSRARCCRGSAREVADAHALDRRRARRRVRCASWRRSAATSSCSGRYPICAPFIARARVAVAPMRAGSGQPLKILEAMASGTPVVATPRAVERPRRDRRRAPAARRDDAERFAAHVVRAAARRRPRGATLAAGRAPAGRGALRLGALGRGARGDLPRRSPATAVRAPLGRDQAAVAADRRRPAGASRARCARSPRAATRSTWSRRARRTRAAPERSAAGVRRRGTCRLAPRCRTAAPRRSRPRGPRRCARDAADDRAPRPAPRCARASPRCCARAASTSCTPSSCRRSRSARRHAPPASRWCCAARTSRATCGAAGPQHARSARRRSRGSRCGGASRVRGARAAHACRDRGRAHRSRRRHASRALAGAAPPSSTSRRPSPPSCPAGPALAGGRPAVVVLGSAGWHAESRRLAWLVRDVWPRVRALVPTAAPARVRRRRHRERVAASSHHAPPADSRDRVPGRRDLRRAAALRLRRAHAHPRGVGARRCRSSRHPAAAPGSTARDGRELLIAATPDEFAAALAPPRRATPRRAPRSWPRAARGCAPTTIPAPSPPARGGLSRSRGARAPRGALSPCRGT